MAPHPSACRRARRAGHSAAPALLRPGPTETARCRWRCTAARPWPPGTRMRTPPLCSAKATGSEVLPQRPTDELKPLHRCDMCAWQGLQTWVGTKAGLGRQAGAAIHICAARHSVQGCHPAGVPYRRQCHTLALSPCVHSCSGARHMHC